MTAIDNTRSLHNTLLKTGSASTSTAMQSKDFHKFYESMQADRKTVSQLSGGNGVEKAQKHIDEAIDFATKLMLAAAKNMGMPDEDSSNKSKEMSDTANSIAQMMATKASINAQMESIEAQKKPPVDLMNLKGKMVDYKDDQKYFSGDPVMYNYKVEHNQSLPSAVVNLTFTVSDKDGNTVATISQKGQAGQHQFIWDGKDDSGQVVKHGKYKLDIEAEGNQNNGSGSTKFAVQANCVLSGIVESVKIEAGTAVGVVIDGKLISRDQISNVRDTDQLTNNSYLTSDLIGKHVELDCSKAQVKNGVLEVYFNNHVTAPGALTVEVLDQDNKFIKTITSEKPISQGAGKIEFDQKSAELADGYYNVKLSVTDISNPESPKQVTLNTNPVVRAIGINIQENRFISIDKDIFNSYNIASISGKYISPIEKRRQEYVGAKISYLNDRFELADQMPATDFAMHKPESAGEIIEYGQMIIYDSNNVPVTILRGDYKLFDMLDERSQGAINDYCANEDNDIEVDTYADIVNRDKRIKVHKHIEAEIKGERLELQAQYKENFAKKVPITFPEWDGTITIGEMAGQQAENGKIYRREFTPIYSDGTSGMTDRELKLAIVDTVDEEQGELFLNLAGASDVRIKEELVWQATSQ